MILNKTPQDDYKWVTHANNLKSKPMSSHRMDMSKVPQYLNYMLCLPVYRSADWMNHSTKIAYVRATFELKQEILNWRREEYSCDGKFYAILLSIVPY